MIALGGAQSVRATNATAADTPVLPDAVLPVPTGTAPDCVAAGPGGTTWFSARRAATIGEITPGGSVHEFPTGEGSSPGAIVEGPDGNMWFTNKGTFGVGRITPDGVVTEFDPTSRAADEGTIAVGPDGNLWFSSGTAIVRVTPGGTVTRFDDVGLNVFQAGVAAGPDGAIWFTDPGWAEAPAAIGRITTTGTVTLFTAGLPADSFPLDIVQGADGNLWFTDGGAGAIGKVTPDGAITEYTSEHGAEGLSVGPDGNIWFSENQTNGIGEITPAGQITEYNLSVPVQPFVVATGADGNLVVTTENSTQTEGTGVATIDIGSPPASVVAPSLGGPALDGSVEQCLPGTWSNWAGQQPSTNAFGFDGFQWLLDGNPIAGQTSQSYTPTAADGGHGLSCRETVTYTLLNVTVSASSAAATVDGAPGNISLPRLSGTAQVGSQLTSAGGGWTGSPTGYSIGWLRCDASGANCTPISDQTDLSYVLVGADQGHTIRSAVTATNANGSATADSAASAVVQAGTVNLAVTQSILDGSTISEPVSWTATPSAPAWSALFYIDGTLVDSDGTSPFTYGRSIGSHLDTTALSDGTHVFRVDVLFKNGTTISSHVSATVSNAVTQPTVTQSIADGSTISGQVTWTAAPSDPAWGVSFYIDGTLVDSDGTFPFSYGKSIGGHLDTTALSDGTHVFRTTCSSRTDHSRPRERDRLQQGLGAHAQPHGQRALIHVNDPPVVFATSALSGATPDATGSVTYLATPAATAQARRPNGPQVHRTRSRRAPRHAVGRRPTRATRRTRRRRVRACRWF